MADPGRALAVVAGHAELPGGLVGAVERIAGRGDVLVPFSNVGLGGEQIEDALRALVEGGGLRVIFTDLHGGSATLAARRIARDHADVVVVTGVNLSALLDFVFAVDSMPPADAARRAAERGRATLTAGPP